MPTFIFSVSVAAASSMLGLHALEAGDGYGALLRFVIASVASLVAARAFVRGVFDTRGRLELG